MFRHGLSVYGPRHLLEFTDKERLTEFFRKARELYPDYFVQTDQTFVSGEHVITQWTLQLTVSKLFYDGRFDSTAHSLGRTLHGMDRILRRVSIASAFLRHAPVTRDVYPVVCMGLSDGYGRQFSMNWMEAQQRAISLGEE